MSRFAIPIFEGGGIVGSILGLAKKKTNKCKYMFTEFA